MSAAIFSLPPALHAKADPGSTSSDERHLSAVAASLRQSIAAVAERLADERRAPGGAGQKALDRDLEVHCLTMRLRALQRYGLDLCLGRMVHAGGSEPVYVGRLGLTDSGGKMLLIDWRSPAAEPFFGATHANPMGLISRRRYRWVRGRITDYWDEVFTEAGLAGSSAALDDQSAFIASLGASRSPQMRDVLGTIQADQDAIIRASSRGALVVDGGPGTGKTVVALHRTAYLLYSHPHLSRGHGRVLSIGPHPAYLAYVADVLPSLGEEGVQICTLRDLVAEGATAGVEDDPAVARLKESAGMVRAVEAAVARFEVAPTRTVSVDTSWADLRITSADWAEAFQAADSGTPHNEAREQVWEALLDILLDQVDEQRDEEVDEFDAYNLTRDPGDGLREALTDDPDLLAAFARAWPLIEAADLVARLWSDPALLQRCAPWLTEAEVAALQRRAARAWTSADLPLLDAARLRLGDPDTARRQQQHRSAVATERRRIADVIDTLIATDDSDMHTMSMLRGQDLRATLIDDAALPTVTPDALAGPFTHIVVDEAQELTDAQWQMLLARNPSRSFTIVGDRAQARHGFTGTWQQHLERVGLTQVEVASLSINYRTPQEIMAVAEPVIRSVLSDANVPTSVRSSGIPVTTAAYADLPEILDRWLAAHDDGVACVIGDAAFTPTDRVRSLTPELSKGLEFDFVALLTPETAGAAVEAAVDRYVAMTRATQQLVIIDR